MSWLQTRVGLATARRLWIQYVSVPLCRSISTGSWQAEGAQDVVFGAGVENACLVNLHLRSSGSERRKVLRIASGRVSKAPQAKPEKIVIP